MMEVSPCRIGPAVEEKVEEDLCRLMRALGRDNQDGILPTYRSLYEAGLSIVPQLKTQLLRLDTSRPQRSLLRIMTCLLSLLHDIDEADSNSIAEQLVSSQECHPIFAARIRTIIGFSVDDYERYDAGCVQVLQDQSLRPAARVRERVSGWLQNVPADDRAGIIRLYVVANECQMYAGRYLRHLAKVVLVWRDPSLFTLAPKMVHRAGHRGHPLSRAWASCLPASAGEQPVP
jgi:hypothetical protein